MKAVGIDIGSNSFRIIVAEIINGQLSVIEKKLYTVRLCKNLIITGTLTTDAMERAYIALRSFNEILQKLQPEAVRICGTAALRTASNRDEFLLKAQELIQTEIEIITGEEEALLSLQGATYSLKNSVPNLLLLVDVGGGSTEFVLADNSFINKTGKHNKGLWTVSLPLGVIGLTEKYLQSTISTNIEIKKLASHIESLLDPALDPVDHYSKSHPLIIVGTGGTATSIAALDLNLTQYDEKLVQGYTISKERLIKVWERLSCQSVEARNRLPGFQDGRGEILPAGIIIYKVLLARLGAEEMMISDAGLLEGILLSAIPRPWQAQ